MSSKENYHKARHARRRSCLPPCFSGSLVFDPDDMESTSAPVPEPVVVSASSRSYWSWLFKKNKEMVPGAAVVPTKSTPAGLQRELCKSKSNKPRSTPQVLRQQEAWINAASHASSIQITSSRHHTRIGSGSGRSIGSAKPNRPTATARETDRRSASLDPLFGLLIVALTLAVMLVCGRACAVAALCACFYLVPLLTSPARRTTEGEIRGKTDAARIDVESADYKKRVVLEGLLDRSGRTKFCPHSSYSLVESSK